MSTALKIATPYGKQHIIFNDPKAIRHAIGEQDIILAVVDERVNNLPKTKQLLDSIETKTPINVLSITINNYTKNTVLLLEIFDEMARLGMTRKSLLVSIGGGATSDIVGVAAAMYMRGIDYAVIPTSFISMADTVISKVAVNHGETKNLVGSFRSPAFTFIDTEYCESIDDLHIAHGLVEIFKQVLLKRDTRRLNEIEALMSSRVIDRAALNALIRWSIKTKATYIVSDWYDTKGRHKALSLGHTLANYLEMRGGYHHAVAVLYGMMLEYSIAMQRKLITETQFESFLRVARLLEGQFNQYETLKPHLEPRVLFESLRKDKISHHGTVKFVLPTRRGYTISPVSEAELERAVNLLHTLQIG